MKIEQKSKPISWLWFDRYTVDAARCDHLGPEWSDNINRMIKSTVYFCQDTWAKWNKKGYHIIQLKTQTDYYIKWLSQYFYIMKK